MKYALVCLLLISACSTKPYEARWKDLPVSVCVENSEQKKIVEDFNYYTGYDFWIISSDNCQVTIQEHDFGRPSPLGKTYYSFSNEHDENGVIYLSGASIQVALSQTFSFEKNEFILSHELGHALGHIYHSEDGLMAAMPSIDNIKNAIRGDFISWECSAYAEIADTIELQLPSQ